MIGLNRISDLFNRKWLRVIIYIFEIVLSIIWLWFLYMTISFLVGYYLNYGEPRNSERGVGVAIGIFYLFYVYMVQQILVIPMWKKCLSVFRIWLMLIGGITLILNVFYQARLIPW